MITRLPRAQGRMMLRLLDVQIHHAIPFSAVSRPAISSSRKQSHHLTSLVRCFSSTCIVQEQKQETPSQPIGKVEPKLSMTFTCTVTDCGHRSTHEFTRRSYERGIVIVQCPSCMNRHLIADHLSWFTENASEPKTIEQMIEAKGGKVQRGMQYVDGKGYETVEMFDDAQEPVKS